MVLSISLIQCKQHQECNGQPLAGLQIDTSSSASDWLIFDERQIDWLTVPSGQYQFENLSQLILVWLMGLNLFTLLVRFKIQIMGRECLGNQK